MDYETRQLVGKVLASKKDFQKTLLTGKVKFDWAKICVVFELAPYKAREVANLCQVFEDNPQVHFSENK